MSVAPLEATARALVAPGKGILAADQSHPTIERRFKEYGISNTEENRPPGGFDIHYCRGLGYWATRFLVEGGTEAMVTLQAERFVPMPFRDLVDAKTGRFRVRYVDVASEAYRMFAAYMIRLTRADFGDPEQLRVLARAGGLGEAEFIARFASTVELAH